MDTTPELLLATIALFALVALFISEGAAWMRTRRARRRTND